MTIDLVYDDTETGDRVLLLLHGGYGERKVFARQVAYFAPRYRIVAPDMRGHGESPKPHDDYTIPLFADDVAALCDRLGVEQADVVGHSMGGPVAVELGHRHPRRVRAIATLDSPSIIPGWTEAHMGPYTADIHSASGRQVLHEFLDAAKLPTDDPTRVAQASAAIDAVPEHMVTAVWDALIAWDPTEAVASLQGPLLYLDHGQPDLDIAGLRALCPQLVTGQTVGSGHRALQEVPDQVNGMLDRFFSHADELADYARRNAGAFAYRES